MSTPAAALTTTPTSSAKAMGSVGVDEHHPGAVCAHHDEGALSE